MNSTPSQNQAPGLTVADVKGVPVDRRASIEQAVMAGGSLLSPDHEAWVVPARKPPAYSVRIVGPRGFYREIRFAGPETPSEIEASVRQGIETHS